MLSLVFGESAWQLHPFTTARSHDSTVSPHSYLLPHLQYYGASWTSESYAHRDHKGENVDCCRNCEKVK